MGPCTPLQSPLVCPGTLQIWHFSATFSLTSLSSGSPRMKSLRIVSRKLSSWLVFLLSRDRYRRRSLLQASNPPSLRFPNPRPQFEDSITSQEWASNLCSVGLIWISGGGYADNMNSYVSLQYILNSWIFTFLDLLLTTRSITVSRSKIFSNVSALALLLIIDRRVDRTFGIASAGASTPGIFLGGWALDQRSYI